MRTTHYNASLKALKSFSEENENENYKKKVRKRIWKKLKIVILKIFHKYRLPQRKQTEMIVYLRLISSFWKRKVWDVYCKAKPEESDIQFLFQMRLYMFLITWSEKLYLTFFVLQEER